MIESSLTDAWEQALLQRQVQRLAARCDVQIMLDDQVRMEIIHPCATVPQADGNHHSVVMRLEMGRFRMLLTGDMDEAAEEALLRQGTPINALVLKVAHHGADTSTSAPFVEAVQPQMAIVSVGGDNRFGHPDPDVLDRLTDSGCEVLRTDRQGTIELITDGERYWIKSHGKG
jgi:competence protein ComEC